MKQRAVRGRRGRGLTEYSVLLGLFLLVVLCTTVGVKDVLISGLALAGVGAALATLRRS